MTSPVRTLGLKHCLERLGRWKSEPHATVETCFRQQGFEPPAIAERTYVPRTGEWFIPDQVIDTILRLAPGGTRLALDPWAGRGFLLSALVEARAASGGVGISHGTEYAFGKPLSAAFGHTWIDAEPFSWLEQSDHTFDLVASAISWGLRPEARTFEVNGERVECRDDVGHLLAAAACLRLAPNGIGLFVVPASFAMRREPRAVIRQLERLGLQLDALLYLPQRAFDPWTSVRGAIAVVRRGTRPTTFVAEVSDSEERLTVIFGNMAAHREGDDVALGRVVQTSEFRGLDALLAAERLVALGAKLGPEWRRVKLANLISGITLVPTGGEHTEAPNTVYLPLIGDGPAATSVGDLHIKAQNYAQLHIAGNQVEPTFLAQSFDTPVGRMARAQRLTGGTIPKLSKGTIPDIEVFIPPITVQRQMIAATTRLKQLTTDLHERAERLWADPASLDGTNDVLRRLDSQQELGFKDWIDRLPFPLASILWAYHAAGGDAKARYEHLVNFFEAVAEFHADILLSAARAGGFLESEEFQRGLRSSMGNATLRRAAFGTWVSILGYLAKRFRTLLNENDNSKVRVAEALRTTDAQVLAMLTSSDLLALLQKANALRNVWVGHTGIVSPEAAADRERALSEFLPSLRGIYGTAWDQLDLVLPGETRVRNGVFRYRARRIMGRSTPFEERQLETEHFLEDARLHLIAAGERRALELLPLVVVGASPGAAQHACYFYSRQQKDGLEFISYHFEQKAEQTLHIDEVTAFIDDLSGAR